MDAARRLKLTLLGSLVGSVLMYGLRLIPIRNTQIATLQSFTLALYVRYYRRDILNLIRTL